MKKIFLVVGLFISLLSSAQRLQDFPTLSNPSSITGMYTLTFYETSLGSGVWLPARKILFTDLVLPYLKKSDSLTFTTYLAHRKSIDSLANLFYTKSQSDARYLQSSALSPYLLSTTAASTYQQALVSGANIKTINGTAVLGSGNISISGGGSLTYPYAIKNYLNGYGNWQALNSDSIIQGSTNLFLTPAERTKLVSTTGTNSGDQDLTPYKLKSDSTATTGYTSIGKHRKDSADLKTAIALKANEYGWLSIEDYGVLPTNSAAANTSAINALLVTALIAKKNLKAGGGQFLFNTILWNPLVNIKGAGWTQTEFRSASAVPLFQYGDTTMKLPASSLSDMYLNGNNVGTIGIDVDAIGYYKFSRLYVQNFTQYAWKGEGNILGGAEDCYFAHCGNGVYLDKKLGTDFGDMPPNQVSFKNCYFQSNPGIGLYFSHGAGLNITDCDFEDNGTSGNASTGAIHINAAGWYKAVGLQATNLWMETNKGSVIRITNSTTAMRHSILNSTIIANPLASYAIYLDGGSYANALKIQGTTIDNSGAVYSTGTNSEIYVDVSDISSHSEASSAKYYTLSYDLVGATNYAYKFGSVSGNQVLTTASSTDFNFAYTDAFTVGFWAKLTSTSSAFRIGTSTSSARIWDLGFSYVGGGYDAPRLETQITGTGGAYKYSYSPPQLLNTWYFITVTYDGTSLKVYINGSDATTASNSGTITAQATGGTFYIGKILTINPADALIDDLFIANTALNSGQVTTLYNSGTVNVVGQSWYSSVLAYWKFEQGLNDEKGTHNASATSPLYETH